MPFPAPGSPVIIFRMDAAARPTWMLSPSLPGISKHLKVLQRAGLITQSRNAQWRPCCLDSTRLKEAAERIGEYQHFWDESFQRLDAFLRNCDQTGRE